MIWPPGAAKALTSPQSITTTRTGGGCSVAAVVRRWVSRSSAARPPAVSHCRIWPLIWAMTLRPMASRVCCGSMRAMVCAGCSSSRRTVSATATTSATTAAPGTRDCKRWRAADNWRALAYRALLNAGSATNKAWAPAGLALSRMSLAPERSGTLLPRSA